MASKNWRIGHPGQTYSSALAYWDAKRSKPYPPIKRLSVQNARCSGKWVQTGFGRDEDGREGKIANYGSSIISTGLAEVPGIERRRARTTSLRECFQPIQSLHRQVPLSPRAREDWPPARRTPSFALSTDQRSKTLERTRSDRFA